jgi:receptor-type tyrosine-protein phosphatase F
VLFAVRRVPPQFTIRPDEEYEVMRGADLEVTCVAVGSPMPHVKWRKGSQDITADLKAKIGKNVLHLKDIQDSANYTCVAGSKLGIIEASTEVRVQG